MLIVAICFNDWFTRWNGAIGILSLCLLVGTWIANFYYLKNERFYLLIQRLLLHFRRTDTTWFFNVHYQNIAKNNNQLPWETHNFAEHIALILKEAVNKPVLIKNQLLNLSSFSLDSLIHLTLRHNSDPIVTLAVDKLLVPAHRYKEYMQTVTEVLAVLERDLRAREVAYTMHIEFPKPNPYFGFFIRHIPKDHLSEFRCTFTPTIGSSGSIINVDKHAIVINTDTVSNSN